MTHGTKAYVASIHEISRKILLARKKKKLKQEVLGLLLDCSRSYISKLEKGISLPSPAFAAKLEEKLSLAKGTLVRPVVRMKRHETILKKQAVQEVRKGRNGFRIAENTLVPLYASLAKTWNENIKDYIAIPKSQVDGFPMFLIEAWDDAMNKTGIHKGDLLLVEVHVPKNNDICVYCVGKECYVRRYQKKNGRIHMAPNSSNKKYKIAIYDHAEIDFKGVVHSHYLKEK